MTIEEINALQRLHDLTVKRAQAYEYAAPGTRTKEAKWDSWQNSEKKFENALLHHLDGDL